MPLFECPTDLGHTVQYPCSDKETEYTMSLGDIKELSLIIDTDDQRFDGQGIPDKAVTVKNGKAVVLLPPFSGRLYAVKSL